MISGIPHCVRNDRLYGDTRSCHSEGTKCPKNPPMQRRSDQGIPRCTRNDSTALRRHPVLSFRGHEVPEESPQCNGVQLRGFLSALGMTGFTATPVPVIQKARSARRIPQCNGVQLRGFLTAFGMTGCTATPVPVIQRARSARRIPPMQRSSTQGIPHCVRNDSAVVRRHPFLSFRGYEVPEESPNSTAYSSGDSCCARNNSKAAECILSTS